MVEAISRQVSDAIVRQIDSYEFLTYSKMCFKRNLRDLEGKSAGSGDV